MAPLKRRPRTPPERRPAKKRQIAAIRRLPAREFFRKADFLSVGAQSFVGSRSSRADRCTQLPGSAHICTADESGVALA